MANDISRRIKASRQEKLDDLSITKLGLSYARNRYFEIWIDLTNKRVDRLLEPEGIGDILLQLAVAGIAGAAVEAALERVLSKLLANRVAYVDVQIKAKIPKEKRGEVRSRLKLHGYDVSKKKVKFNHQLILTENTPESLLYKVLPDFVGSRIDELLQEDPPKESFWPATSSVADYMLQLEAWVEAQQSTLNRIHDDFEELANTGFMREVSDALDFQNAAVPGGIPRDSLQKRLIEQGKLHGQFYLACLFVRRFGDPDNIGAVTKGYTTIGVQRTLVEILTVRPKDDFMGDLLRVLEEELFDPNTDPPKTFIEHSRVIVRKQGLGSRFMSEEQYARQNARARVLRHLRGIYREMQTGPVPSEILKVGSESGKVP